MGQVLLQLDHVSKRFLLDRSTNRSVIELFARPFRRGQHKQYYWPLRDVSLKLERGQSLGIIGENGSGKSTVLKLMAGILEPTGGTVETFGRVAALLELGASFHPELTGRENIFLAASIAGISRASISRHLDEIIAFADIGPYIDVAVKHYSSGMYVRLGFAVALHLEPDALLIDEVLAVGDEAFQHKCLQAIKQLQRSGVSTVLVSHSMGQIVDMCTDAVWLHDGLVCSTGAPREVIEDYLAVSSAEEQAAFVAGWGDAGRAPDAPGSPTSPGLQRFPRGAPSADARRWGDGAIVIRKVRLLDTRNRTVSTIEAGQSVQIEIDYAKQRSVEELPVFGIAIYRIDDTLCYGTNTGIEGERLGGGALADEGTVIVSLPDLNLLGGHYTLDFAIHAPSGRVTHDYVRAALNFSVHNARGDSGIFRPATQWSLRAAEKVLP